MYASSLIDAFANDLKSNLLGNPHSASPSSDLSTTRVNNARRQVLEYFNADPEYFDVIFTQNATAAIKVVLYSFEKRGFNYGYYRDSHTSIVGVRETASYARYFGSSNDVEEWIQTGAVLTPSNQSTTLKQDNSTHPPVQLFAYPAQSNMNGHRPPLRWCKDIRSWNNDIQKTYVLLDAASYLTTGRLDFSNPEDAPDFTSLSFYKIFGFPDLGALIVRKSAADVLDSRRYFGGGTVDMIISSNGVNESWHALKTHALHERFEDGTLPFHNIAALEHAMRIQKQIFGSASQISEHVNHLVKWLYAEMVLMRHDNGRPVIKIYKDHHSRYGLSSSQGPIIAFNIMDKEGEYIGKSAVESLAIACGIQLRTGGVCNPGGIAAMLDLSPWEMRRNFTEGVRCGNDHDVLGAKPTGIIRVSLGAMSTMQDVKTFARFLRQFFVQSTISKLSTILVREIPLEMLSDSGYDTSSDNSSDVHPTNKSSEIPLEPIEGFKPAKIEFSSTLHATKLEHDSISTWHHRWCLVKLDEKNILTSDQLAELDMTLTIRPEQGLLEFQNGQNGQSLTIDLWKPPIPSNDSESASLEVTPRKPDLYDNPDIASFFTSITGTPCTLGHYQSLSQQSVQEKSYCCVVASCNEKFDSNITLNNHNNTIHAQEFKPRLITNSPPATPQILQLPPRNVIVIEPEKKSRTWFSVITSFGKSSKSRSVHPLHLDRRNVLRSKHSFYA